MATAPASPWRSRPLCATGFLAFPMAGAATRTTHGARA